MTDSARHDYDQIVKSLKNQDFDSFAREQLKESDLQSIAMEAGDSLAEIAGYLIEGLTSDRYTSEFDWNTGRLLLRIKPNAEVVITNISPKVLPLEDLKKLHRSSGLAWVLGEFGRRDPAVVRFLEDVVADNEYHTSASWFEAAHSLHKLREVDDAISYLKACLRAVDVPSLQICLSDPANQKYRIAILLYATPGNIQEQILPEVKRVLRDSRAGLSKHVGAIWVALRLRCFDPELEQAILSLLGSPSYWVRFYTLEALVNSRSLNFRGSSSIKDIVKSTLCDQDPQLRKLATRLFAVFDSRDVVNALEDRLFAGDEADRSVQGETTRALYRVCHYAHRREMEVVERLAAPENGSVSKYGRPETSGVTDQDDDQYDWYDYPEISHMFSDAHDPLNLCFRLATDNLRPGLIDPVDIGCGTGRFALYLYRSYRYEGTLWCLDDNPSVTKYLEARFRRECITDQLWEIRTAKINDITTVLGECKSELVVASFAFPSNRQKALEELSAVHSVLRKGGTFITVGWDETFNDELSEMWYKYVPDTIRARNFDQWSGERRQKFRGARNCGLNWYKQGLEVPLEFDTHERAAQVMSFVFGRAAGEEIIRTRKNRWWMSLGITRHTKEQSTEILDREPRTINSDSCEITTD